MKTTITINGLPVEFTDEVPVNPGVYWFRARYELAPSLMDVRGGDDGTLFVPGEGLIGGQWLGVWSAPLIPSDRLTKALDLLTKITAGHFYQSSCRGGEMERLMNQAIEILGGKQ